MKNKFRLLTESQLEKAEIVFAIQNIVDDMQDIAEKISNMRVETVSPLVERMKAEFGVKMASSFNSNVGQYLQEALESVMTAKDSIDNEKLKISGDAKDEDLNDMSFNDSDDMVSDASDEDLAELPKLEIKEEPRQIKNEGRMNEGEIADKFSKNFKIKQLKSLIAKLDSLKPEDVDKVLASIDLSKIPANVRSMVTEAKRKCKKSLKESKAPTDFTVWVGDGEVNEYYLTYEDAEKLAFEYIDDGYDDVYIENVKTNDIYVWNKRAKDFVKEKKSLKESKTIKTYKLLIETKKGNTITKKFRNINNMKTWLRENNTQIKSIKHV